MSDSIRSLLASLDARVIAQRVGNQHDEARIKFQWDRNTVRDSHEFKEAISRYYIHHLKALGRIDFMPDYLAFALALKALESHLDSGPNSLSVLFRDAHDGTNGGLKAVLDRIANALKVEEIEGHIQDQFRRYADPMSWEDQLELVRQFIRACGPTRLPGIALDKPEQYINNYRQLIRAYVETIQQATAPFRGL